MLISLKLISSSVSFKIFLIYFIIKKQFYEKIQIIYKNIYKFKGTSNISDLNLENADIEAEDWANQKEEELLEMKKMRISEESFLEMYLMS